MARIVSVIGGAGLPSKNVTVEAPTPHQRDDLGVEVVLSVSDDRNAQVALLTREQVHRLQFELICLLNSDCRAMDHPVMGLL